MAIWNVQHRVSVYQFIVFWAWEAFFQHGGRHARSNMRGHKNIKGSDRSEISVHYFLCVYTEDWKSWRVFRPPPDYIWLRQQPSPTTSVSRAAEMQKTWERKWQRQKRKCGCVWKKTVSVFFFHFSSYINFDTKSNFHTKSFKLISE